MKVKVTVGAVTPNTATAARAPGHPGDIAKVKVKKPTSPTAKPKPPTTGYAKVNLEQFKAEVAKLSAARDKKLAKMKAAATKASAAILKEVMASIDDLKLPTPTEKDLKASLNVCSPNDTPKDVAEFWVDDYRAFENEPGTAAEDLLHEFFGKAVDSNT